MPIVTERFVFIGKTWTLDGGYTIPYTSQGWIYNGTDVEITLQFSNNTSVKLVSGQSHNWQPANKAYDYINVIIAGKTTGSVNACYLT